MTACDTLAVVLYTVGKGCCVDCECYLIAFACCFYLYSFGFNSAPKFGTVHGYLNSICSSRVARSSEKTKIT